MDRVFVDEEGTGRSTFDVEGLSRWELDVESTEDILWIEYERPRPSARLEKPREGGGGASPKMKNLMKAPIRRTTESCPTRRPWVNDNLHTQN